MAGKEISVKGLVEDVKSLMREFVAEIAQHDF